MATKVTLRKRELPSGKITLYLDFYPAIRNPRTMAMTRREYLGIYLVKDPKKSIDKQSNAEKLAIAEAIRAQRELSVINEEFGFIDKAKRKMDFLSYFKEKLRGRDKKWHIVYQHFTKFVHGECTFAEINIELCEKFRTYLLNATQLKHQHLKVSVNSAAGYWSTFRAMLAVAYKEKMIAEDVNDFLDRIETVDTHRFFLTIDEVRRLHDTPCKDDVVKRASLFSILTGLRMSDILALTWEKFEIYPDGGHCVRLTTEKTDASAYNPVSKEAYEICGTPSTGLVFKSLSKSHINRVLTEWMKDAGINKHITFHCFRHTFATLLVSNGSDIYTVSKMLTHKNVATTQIYADIIDEKKRAAAEIIKIKNNDN